MPPILVPSARAARLTALSREAQEQSVKAIRRSLRLLRHPIYPEERSPSQLSRPSAPSVETEGERDDRASEGYCRDRRIGG